ncbi:hypothetical protein REPUB_Repub09cG0193400 [Reevesia pubescens]
MMRLSKTVVISVPLLFLVALSGFANGFVKSPRTLLNPLSENNKYLTTNELWFDQTLDHYDHRQFQQRYYEFLDHFQVPDGPIFLNICGESSCPGIANDYISVKILTEIFLEENVESLLYYYFLFLGFQVLAKKFGAAVVSLEHRYYGKSTPFKSYTTENLKYLSSKQALFDLAVFRQWYQESLNLKRNKTDAENPWFVFGISYSGALSAWFRLKFPHLTCGSLASSAVVLAVYNFTEFDKQIGESAGPECKAALQEITQLLEIDGDFLYYLADAAVTAFQYGNPDTLCIPLVEAKKAGEDLVGAYSKYVKEYYGVSVESYNQKHLKNTDNSDRLWWFQVCTEVAYFQVAPSNDSIRSSKVDTKYHLDLCKNVFGEGIYPDVYVTNIYYGGTKIAGSKIIFTNGSQDPWRHASKQTSSPEMPSYLITCHNCGHGTDMRGCPQSPLSIEGNAQNCSSPDAVQKVRQQMIEHIDLWLSECKGTGSSSM